MEQSSHRQSSTGNSVRLPELEIPSFDCDKMKWTEFWDYYQVTVDENKLLYNIEMFSYLKSSLIDDVKETKSGILISNDNYEVAKRLLKERIEDNN